MHQQQNTAKVVALASRSLPPRVHQQPAPRVHQQQAGGPLL